MISYEQFRKYAMWPVVKHFNTPNKAIQCLGAFAAHESDGGKYMNQVRGPAMGPYQMEPATKRLVDRWVQRQPRNVAMDDLYLEAPLDELRTDLKCATWYARILLLADPHALPGIGDMDGLYETYRRVWGPGKPPSKALFIKKWNTWRKT